MSTKTCTLCLEAKPLTEFHRHAPSKDGRKPRCKSCQNRAETARRLEPDHRAVQAWHDLNKRVRNQPEYIGIEVLISKESFIAWATVAFKEWVDNNPGQTPSVDRRDPAGHYEISNLRVISWGENSRLRRTNHNVHAPDGQAWCGKCKVYKPVPDFERNRSKPHGLQNHCRQCRATSRRKPGTYDTKGAAHS